MKALMRKCRVKSGRIRVYLRVGESWKYQEEQNIVVVGGYYAFLGTTINFLPWMKKEMDKIDEERNEKRKEQIRKRKMNLCLLPERY